MPKIVYVILVVFVVLLAFVFVLDELRGLPFDATGYLLLLIVSNLLGQLFGFHLTEAGSTTASGVAAATAETLAKVVASDKATTLITANAPSQSPVPPHATASAPVPNKPMAVDGVGTIVSDIVHVAVNDNGTYDIHYNTGDQS